MSELWFNTTCLWCKNDFHVPKGRTSNDAESLLGKFCSKKCSAQYKTENNIGIYSKDMERPWLVNENNYQWKGDDASYRTKHQWIKRRRGFPTECQHCGLNDPNGYYEWATISGNHLRDVNDWLRLCKKCHVKMDDSCRGFREWNAKPIRPMAKRNKSGFKNVRLTKEGRFRAYITVNKKQVHLGNFDTGEEAYEAYKARALELYGEY